MRYRDALPPVGRRPQWILLVTVLTTVALVIVPLAASSNSRKLAGTPITVMSISPVNSSYSTFPEIFAVGNAYAADVNSHGGINGHPLKVITCDDRNDPNQLVFCAHEAIKDHVVAIVGSFTENAQHILPLLQHNHIAWFGICCAVQSQELTSPISFPLGSGPALNLSLGVAAGETCKKPVVVVYAAPSANFLLGLYKQGIASTGRSFAKSITVPATATDYSPQVEEALSGGADCVVMAGSQQNYIAWFTAQKTLGFKAKVFGPEGNLNAAVASQFPDTSNGSVAAFGYPDVSSSLDKEYVTALKTYHAPAKVGSQTLDYNGIAATGAWAAYKAFTDIVSKLKVINNVTFLNAASHSTRVSAGGLTPPVNFTKPLIPKKAYTRMFNANVTFDLFENGKVVPLNKFYNIAPAFEGKKVSPAISLAP